MHWLPFITMLMELPRLKLNKEGLGSGETESRTSTANGSDLLLSCTWGDASPVGKSLTTKSGILALILSACCRLSSQTPCRH